MLADAGTTGIGILDADEHFGDALGTVSTSTRQDESGWIADRAREGSDRPLDKPGYPWADRFLLRGRYRGPFG